MKPKYLLIIGSQHSGTSWLAAMLFAHSQINGFDEAFTRDALKGYGKPWIGNKLCLYNHIRYKQRGNLLALYFDELYYARIFPRSLLSIRDYMRLGAKIIVIMRNTYALVESMKTRSGFSEKKAMREIRKGDKIVEQIVEEYNDNCEIVYYENLKNTPVAELQLLCAFLDLEFELGMIEQGTECNFRYGEHGEEYVQFRTKAV